MQRKTPDCILRLWQGWKKDAPQRKQVQVSASTKDKHLALIKLLRRAAARLEMGGWESIEMVQRYAHLAPNHLTEHAKKSGGMIEFHVTNLALCDIEEKKKEA